MRRRLMLVALVLVCGGLLACRPRKQEEMASGPELPYPTCPAAAGEGSDGATPPAAPDVLAEGDLRGQEESMSEGAARERFRLERRGCLVVYTGRQEWALGATDVEVVFDEELRPLRAWKRMTLPLSERDDGHADVRRYELRTEAAVLKQRRPDGEVRWAKIRGARPTAVIGPGRGLLTAWIRRAHLAVGDKVREPVLDFREMLEVVREVTLRREADRFDPALGRTVRVYTIYGREAVFTDEEDVVLGDLAGMRPASSVASPERPSAPLFGAPDPVGTP